MPAGRLHLNRSGDATHYRRSAGLFATPAARITLITPAVKPSRKNTISPQGDVDSKRSKPQPMAAPTSTPAINSDERRKPRAIADALAEAFPSLPSD